MAKYLNPDFTEIDATLLASLNRKTISKYYAIVCAPLLSKKQVKNRHRNLQVK